MSAADWLHRLDARGWLDAAQTEIDAGQRRVAERRAAVTHARRACGMALNAVLVAWTRNDPGLDPIAPWGRSYLDHLRALADGVLGPLDADAAALARAVLDTPVAPPALVALGRRNADVIELLTQASALQAACAAAAARLGSAAL